MKVYNLLGHKNQFIINDWDAFYFQSYDTMVGAKSAMAELKAEIAVRGELTIDRYYYLVDIDVSSSTPNASWKSLSGAGIEKEDDGSFRLVMPDLPPQ